jgi:methionine-rich copper-binding protein CopC
LKTKFHWLKRALVTAATTTILLFLSLFLSPANAFAHAQLISTYPDANTILSIAPTTIALNWGEDVRTNSDEIVLADSTGHRIASNYSYKFDAAKSRGTVTLKPETQLPAGSYIVSWRAVSRDSHLVGGAYSFGINQKPTKIASSGLISYPDKILQVLYWLLMILSFGSLLAGQFFIFIPTAFILIVVSGIRIMLLSSILPRSYLDSGTSRISLLSIIVFALVLSTSLRWLFGNKAERGKIKEKFDATPTPLRAFQLALIALLFGSQEFFEGHALDVAHPATLKYIAAGHLFFAILWTGSVTALLLARTREQYVITRKISTVSIALLIPLATRLTFFLALPVHDLTRTYWTLFLALKLACVMCALAIGAYHHFAGVKIARDPEFNFRRSLKIEVGAIAAILVLTMLMVSFSPPKILSLQGSSAVNSRGSQLTQSKYEIPLTFDDGLTGVLEIGNLRLGSPSQISIRLNGPKVQSAKSIFLYFSNAKLNLTDIQVTLTGSKNNYSSVVLLPAAGSWHIDVQLLIDAFTETQANLAIIIK